MAYTSNSSALMVSSVDSWPFPEAKRPSINKFGGKQRLYLDCRLTIPDSSMPHRHFQNSTPIADLILHPWTQGSAQSYLLKP